MDRLTWRRPGDNKVCPRVPKDSDTDWILGEFTQTVYERLAQYEETGKTVAQIYAMEAYIRSLERQISELEEANVV